MMTTAVMKWKKRDEEEIQTREKAEMARRISMGQEINLNRTSLRVKLQKLRTPKNVHYKLKPLSTIILPSYLRVIRNYRFFNIKYLLSA